MQETPARSGPRPTVEQFLRLVMRSGLLSRAQLQDSLRGFPPAQREDAEAIAAHLVRLGRLSRFQAGKLLLGTARGLVLGPFQVLAPIGRGGMGTVYLARDHRSADLLALKVLPPRKARTDERLLARFQREMEMCQRVAHPNLAWTYEVGVCQGVYYIAMEYIPGKTLFRVVNEQGPLPVGRASRLLAEVCSALEHAHARGLIHRDIKPANILVTPRDHAKLLDLGLALMLGETGGDRAVVGGQGYIVGTMDYISPEQAANPVRADQRSDLYSLGCTLFYALTGQPPFPGGSSVEKMQRHKEDAPPFVTDLNPTVPAAFARVVHRLMAKSPEQRYPSMAAVAEELKRWSADEEVAPLDHPDDIGYMAAVAELENRSDDLVAVEPVLDTDDEPTLPEAEVRGGEEPVLLELELADEPELVPERDSGGSWPPEAVGRLFLVLGLAGTAAATLGLLLVLVLVLWLHR